MLKMCITSLVLCLASNVAISTRANAGIFEAYVASNGNDTNNCSVSAPCATIQHAHDNANVGGSVVCLSAPLGYLANITKSITIDCSAIVVSEAHGQTAYTINVGSGDPLQFVRIKGVRINGDGIASSVGIMIQSAGTVVLENLDVQLHGAQGILDQRSSPGTLRIKDSKISKNTGPGIVIAGATGNIAIFDNVTLENNSYGVAVGSGNRVSINHSIVSNNTTAGVEADGGSLVIVDGSTIANNNVGIASGSAIRLSNNNIQFNTTGVSGATGTYGNNRFAGNGSDGTALTPVGGGTTDLGEK